MCLYVNSRVKSSKRVVAYKVVRGVERRPPYLWWSRVRYKKGRVVKVDRKRIHKSGYYPTINYGLHVYTSLRKAKAELDFWDGRMHHIVKVQVRPKDWIADGNEGNAVYCRLKVLT